MQSIDNLTVSETKHSDEILKGDVTLEWYGERQFNRFDIILHQDGRTDGQTDRLLAIDSVCCDALGIARPTIGRFCQTKAHRTSWHKTETKHWNCVSLISIFFNTRI